MIDSVMKDRFMRRDKRTGVVATVSYVVCEGAVVVLLSGRE